MDWIDDESFWLQSPPFAYELIGREPLQGLETATEVVGDNKAFEIGSKLHVMVVVEAFDCRLFEGSVHPLDLSIGPGMLRLCQPMFDPLDPAGSIKRMSAPYSGRP